jgi:signal transduction histidine kinase/ActR/RegA family two-component response regulator
LSKDGVLLDDLRPVAKRVMRLARDICGAYAADVVLLDDDNLWRVSLPATEVVVGGPNHRVITDGEPLWIEDIRVISPAKSRGSDDLISYAGVPIRRENGEILGSLCVVDTAPRAYDAKIMKHLRELSALIVDAFERLKAMADLDQASQALQSALERTARSEERLKLAAKLANIQVWEIDHNRREISSDGAAELAPVGHYADAERGIWSTIHPKDLPAAKAAWKRHLEDGTPFQIVHRSMRRDGPHLWVETAAEAVLDADGKIGRVVGAIRMIDREKRNELELVKARDAAEAANRAKSTFLATMSHEIRTPLNGVLGMAQAMAADDLSARQRERLDVVRNSGETLLAILNDVLDLSKIESGKLDLEETEFDIGELAHGAHDAFSAVAAGKGLTFELQVARGARGVYRGDATRVRQIFYNLVSNALKFTEAGGVSVVVRRVRGVLEMAVTDTGIGIAPDRLTSLFQKFEQADASTTRRFGGTGLGLAICRELAALMDGAIRVESIPDAGSTFTVTLPLTRLSHKAAARPARAAPAPDSAVADRPMRVLAAEDNAVNQLVLKTLLDQVGVEVVLVQNGVDAVAAWESQEWDVILMDVQMPRMDGPTAASFIRERERAQGRARTPIIALTANAMAHQVAEYLAIGMDGFVAKPIEIERLFSALQAVLAPAGASPGAQVSAA